MTISAQRNIISTGSPSLLLFRMGVLVAFSIMSRMIVLVGAVISPVFMVMHMGLTLVFMLM